MKNETENTERIYGFSHIKTLLYCPLFTVTASIYSMYYILLTRLSFLKAIFTKVFITKPKRQCSFSAGKRDKKPRFSLALSSFFLFTFFYCKTWNTHTHTQISPKICHSRRLNWKQKEIRAQKSRKIGLWFCLLNFVFEISFLSRLFSFFLSRRRMRRRKKK